MNNTPDTTDRLVTGAPAVELTLERDTAVNGTSPNDDDNADRPVRAENDVPPPTKGRPQG